MTTIDRKKKLGKGLGALLGETRREEPLVRDGARDRDEGEAASADRSTLAAIPVAAIEPLPGQPRTHFDDDALNELAASISARGVIQPIIVRPKGGGRYQLVAGERRWRAAQRARLHEIPAIVRELEEQDVMALALVENLQREDLNPVEEARAYQKLADEQGMTQADIAKLVDKSRSHVANLQRLLALPDKVLSFVADNRLSMGHARALIGNAQAVEIAQDAIERGLSVRDVERLVKGQQTRAGSRDGNPAAGAPANENNADLAAIQDHLGEFLGLPVKIAPDRAGNSGSVTISYRTLDQLDLICQRLTGGEI